MHKKSCQLDAAAAPNDDTEAREYQLALARTAYNYMRSYPNLEAVPLCASVPEAEAFSADYNTLVARSSAQIAENFLVVAQGILTEEFEQDSKVTRLFKLLADVQAAAEGLKLLSAEALAKGPTAVLKSTLYDLLRTPHKDDWWSADKDFLKAERESEYAALIKTLPKPLMLTLAEAPWMAKQRDDSPRPHQLPCQQDWFFGYLQVAGFNTTNLRGLVAEASEGSKAVVWSELQRKFGFTKDMFPLVLGDKTKNFDQALEEGKLFVCDYTGLIGDGKLADKESTVHGEHRYLPSPIALFYWNEKPPHGYPPGYRCDGSNGDGVLQPIAIQLAPTPGTIFTPNNIGKAAANDEHGWKWQIAKYFVNVACAIQHESVAHLGDCHFIIESIAVATHRQLSEQHSLFKLLAPHLRFTLSINGGALSNLVVPGGVVATNVGPNIHWTLEMVNEARKAYRWADNHPERIFGVRGVDVSGPLVFPFRDDTLLLWQATKRFVGRYVNHHFVDNNALKVDQELQGWLAELGSPDHANLQGLSVPSTREQLTELLAQIVYTAGPLHAAVNYAQYPLGAYMPSVAATIYAKAPTADSEVNQKNYLSWFPPLDIALYTLSFEYLLSSVQYDVFGHYTDNPQRSYFAEEALQQALEDFQAELADAEREIVGRNRKRPMPYPFQLPSRIPNSISI